MGLIPRSAESIARANTIINERNAKREGSVRVDARGTPVNSFGRRLEFSAGAIAVVSRGGAGDDVDGAVDSGHGRNPEHIKWPDLASESEGTSRETSENDLSGIRRTTTSGRRRDQRASSSTTTTIKNSRNGDVKQQKKTNSARIPLETTIEYVPSSDDEESNDASNAFERLPSRGAGNAISAYDDDSDESDTDEDKYRKAKPTKVVVLGGQMLPKKSSLKAKGTVRGRATADSARSRSLNKRDEFSQPPQEEGCAVCCAIS